MANPNPSHRFPKGHKFGRGVAKGSKQARTIEKEMVAKYANEVASTPGKPQKFLGREILSEMANYFRGRMGAYQPTTNEADNTEARHEKFMQMASMARDCAIAVAKYESPTYRAIMVADAAPKADPEDTRKRFSLTIFENGRSPRVIEPEGKKRGAA